MTSGPGDQCRDRYCHGLHGFDPDGRDHRPGADAYIGQDAFRKADTVGITRPLRQSTTSWSRMSARLASMKAFHIAKTGRPGPVLVDIPKDITARPASSSIRRPSDALLQPGGQGPSGADQEGVQLLDAKRPMIYRSVGSSCRTRRKLMLLDPALGFPVTNTLMGLGAYQRYRSRTSACSACTAQSRPTWRCSTADVLLAIGARFDDRVIGNPENFGQNRARSSTSTSIRRRSPSASRSMSRSSATYRMCWTKCSSCSKAASRPDARRWPGGRYREWRAKKCLNFKQGDDLIMPQFVVRSSTK